MARERFVSDVVGKATVGTLVAYDFRGVELWRGDDFVVSRDMVPRGVGLAMSASVLIDGKSGEVLRRWNPWGVLGGVG